ncbi:EAL domain-containing protein [Cryptosporangium phraense]|uniref:EAL domain-containing protein n=1 Tax=Cryptosporangium phraense TaxID=2593070 RepID=A0A545AWA2_9ACTN|nr:EAL domain-containing protein [Cryptosporangium phraense]TQS45604.1 EAL domain-containing protein [Cryptosporangium phraense]
MSGDWEQVERLLSLARRHLGMDLAWMSEFSAGDQIVRAASGDAAAMKVTLDERLSLDGSYCMRVVSGQLPPVIPDTRRHPVTRDLTATAQHGIGAYVGVPWRQRDGQVGGMLCVLNRSPNPDLDKQSERFLALIADLISEHVGSPLEPAQKAPCDDAERIRSILDAGAVRMVFQPIVELSTGKVVAFEALARFDDPALPTPAHAFAAADRAGLGVELELLAVQRALERLDDLPDDIGMGVNLSAEALLTPAVQDVLIERASKRLAVELTEHTQVSDYAALTAVTERLQRSGVHIAVDDAGAGFASLRHILKLRPDAIKLDIELIRGIDTDPVRQALTRSLVAFTRDIGAALIAEGIEVPAEREMLLALGVELGQGYLMAKPGPLPMTVRALTE